MNFIKAAAAWLACHIFIDNAEKLLKEQKELVNKMREKLDEIDTMTLDTIDIENLNEAWDILDMIDTQEIHP